MGRQRAADRARVEPKRHAELQAAPMLPNYCVRMSLDWEGMHAESVIDRVGAAVSVLRPRRRYNFICRYGRVYSMPFLIVYLQKLHTPRMVLV